MASVDFSDFDTKTTAQPTDFIVGYDLNASGGEKKYTVSTLANAVSSVASLGTVKSVTGTAPISVVNGTTTPVISVDAATTSAAGSMSSTDKARLDDASTVNGLLSCNGSGNFSAAVAGTDYLTSATLSASPTSAKAWAVVSWNDGSIGTTAPTLVNDYNISTAVREGTLGKVLKLNFTTPIIGYKAVVASSGRNGIFLSDTTGGNTDPNLLNRNNYVLLNFQEAGEVDPGLPWNCVVIFGS
jgi:hypothetical protein